MKTEFMAAITQLSSERNLPKEVILEALEAALVSAYKKEVFTEEQDVAVKIDTLTGDIHVYLLKTVTDEVTDNGREISVEDARKLRGNASVGDVIEIESTPKSAGRIAAQIARQVVLQRLREAEQHAAFEQFAGKEGEVVSGIVQFTQPGAVYVNIGRREAILPTSEQLPNERYHAGQQLKFYLLQASVAGRGPRILLSRSHPNLVRRLFEIEIPEVHSGIVEIRAVARDPGHRSKVAVSSTQESVEPVGSCLGPRGIRLQSIANQLNGEKIDVVEWSPDPVAFIANALSPAQVSHISLDEEEKTATVIVPDRQLSLAIGRGGQNARLAARLTGWRIDIKSTSAAEAETGPAPAAETAEEEEALETQLEPETTEEGAEATVASEVPEVEETETATPVEEKGAAAEFPLKEAVEPRISKPIEPVQPSGKETGATGETHKKAEQPAERETETLEELLASEMFRFEDNSGKEESVLRFAEDILPGSRGRGRGDRGKSKGKKKRKTYYERPDE
ncbi:MAG TPA: transcription termination/antitermination protein NusA [Dehalococcoidia bacterium]|nr:transcription termination/antitermination protein NusA [Dehalococcoidia bacterium]